MKKLNLKKKLRTFRNYLLAIKTGNIIYQMGKVGSSSIEHSADRSVAHIHTFALTVSRYFIKKKLNLLDYMQYILKQLLLRIYKLRGDKRIITLVREPVARNVSCLFQALENYTDIKITE